MEKEEAEFEILTPEAPCVVTCYKSILSICVVYNSFCTIYEYIWTRTHVHSSFEPYRDVVRDTSSYGAAINLVSAFKHTQSYLNS